MKSWRGWGRVGNRTDHEDTENRHFRTAGLRQDLRRRSVRAGAASAAGQVAGNLLNLMATVVLARLLTPADFGLVAMVTVVIGFTIMLRDLGLSSAMIQREDLGHGQVSTLFWVNAAAGLFLTLLIMACAPLIAWFYGRPQLVSVTLALATLSMLDGLSIQHQALLRRQLRMVALAVIDLLSLLAGILTAIVLAWRGAGFWSLVAMQIASMTMRTALTWLTSGWRPDWSANLAEVRGMLAFGGQLTGARMVNYASRNVDKLLIGKFWSAQELGVYAKAFAGSVVAFEKAIHSLSRVAVPTLSRLQDDPARFRTYFQTAVLLLATVALPVAAALILEAEAAVRMVLGAQWLATIPLLKILAAVAVAHLLAGPIRWGLVSLGRGERLLRWRTFEALAKVIGIAIGLRWGVIGIAWGLLIVNAVLAVPALWYCFYDSPLRIRDVAEVIWKPLVATLAASGVVLGMRYLGAGGINFVVDFALELAALGAGYLAVWLLLPGGAATLRELLRLAGDLHSVRGAQRL